tara:strand:- start:5139 stop:6818 length:1680 start_codon:yes stop_codon:yes gene_type:complete
MSWKKHFTVYNGGGTGREKASPSANRWQSYLPELYSGHPNRVERYMQYDAMDMDSEVNAALDTISEFSTQVTDDDNLPFEINYKDDSTESEIEVLGTALRQWCNINEFDKRLFRLFRNTIKYGDQIFVRDPETYKLMWVNPVDVIKVILNESKGKEPEQYILKNIDLNMETLVASEVKTHKDNYNSMNPAGGENTITSINASGTWANNGKITEYAIDASNIVHIALTEGMDTNYPFGTSILDPIFKTFKQKELLEDSIIIYRVQRAPERRVFYVDVGDMPSHKAVSFVERVKNEIHQRRIPSKTGGGANIMDSSYNPLSIMEDYFFAQTAEGRGSKVEVLPGGENLGQIDDLKYFTNKMLRALRVPSSYLPTGPEDGTASYNDGRVGTAFIQEYRFNKYCLRLQNIMQDVFDNEFKMYCKHKGIEVPAQTFELRFLEPQSFSDYRSIELDSQRAGLFNNLEGVPYLSRRFILSKYLGLNEDEIVENERMWKEEMGTINQLGDADNTAAGLSNIGMRPEELNTDNAVDIAPDADLDDETSGESSPLGADNVGSDAGSPTQ